MRGTPYLSEEFATLPGIIPAYAGNTSIFSTPTGMTRDHPRVCGEHGGCGNRDSGVRGSSPRMRGTQGERMDSTLGVGIIPAYAGNTLRD